MRPPQTAGVAKHSLPSWFAATRLKPSGLAANTCVVPASLVAIRVSPTSTAWAPWYVIPADNKWFTRLAVAAVVVAKMQEIDPQYPTVSAEHRRGLLEARRMLEKEM